MAEKKVPFDEMSRSKRKKSNKKPKKAWKVFKIFLLVMILLMLIIGGAASTVAINYINDAPPFDPALLATVETSYLYDKDGNEITALHEEQNRIIISLDSIPLHVQQAFIAIEDERFYRHFGFDIIGSIRAAYANFQAGTIVQGASTLSQQLAQNAFLSTETTYKRKVQEIWLAIQLERSFGKDEILEMYMNRMYFGNGAYGVEAAALTYFNKSADQLGLAEAAMLAGALRSPNLYNPIDNVFEAEQRMRVVLANMRRVDFISEEEYRSALEQELIYSEPPSQEYPYPHFVDYVVHHELIRILSAIPEIGSRTEAYRAIYTGGLRVYTTLEQPLQSHVEDVLSRNELYPSTVYYNMPQVRSDAALLPEDEDLDRFQLQQLIDEEGGVPQPQAAIVVADPNTGQIKALGGGREYRKKINEILRFSTLRQPGSAIKPIITYAPAFEEGVLAGAASTLDDSPYIGPRADWFPENFDYRFRGMITAREALYFSYNVPAVRAFEMLGTRLGADYARRMGISTLHDSEIDNISLTLGGFTNGVSALDMAQAYGVLANDGVRVDLHTVRRIEDRHGEVIYEYRANPRQILSPQATFLVSDILQDFVTEYIGRALQIDRPVAAKTGTTENWKDVYLVAYTPNLVASFWMGFDEPKLGSIPQGWRFSTVFLREVFLEAFKDLEIKEFNRPEGIVQVSVCSRSGLLPNQSCQAADSVVTDYFIAEHAPNITCDMHSGFAYKRPPYILTDERWFEDADLGRGPEDVMGLTAGHPSGAINEQTGSVTTEITLFKAYITDDGITLQWQYNGPDASGFTLSRTTQGISGEEQTFNLDSSSRQYLDSGMTTNQVYTYSLTANIPGAGLSETAAITIRFVPGAHGPVYSDDDDIEMVAVPNVVGSIRAIAENRIDRVGLFVGVVDYIYHDSVMKERVVQQQPQAGTMVPIGSRIYLWVSSGSKPDN